VCGEPARITLRAVAVNGAPIVPTGSVVVAPGDHFEVEVYLSDWAAQGLNLYTWQVGMRNAMLEYSGDKGRIVARMPGPDEGFCENTGAPCTNSSFCTQCVGGPNDGANCLNEQFCDGFACQFAECVTGGESGFYIADFVCSAGSVRPGRSCQVDADCPEGACVVRPDFVFAEREQRICAVMPGDGFVAGCTLTGGEADALEDGGLEYYAVTAEYDVSLDALGEFTLAVGAQVSFLNDYTSGGPFIFFAVEPLLITVEPGPPTGACCDCSGLGSDMAPIAVCSDGVSQAECQGDSQLWTGDRTCTDVGCVCGFEPIPAVSEWGLLVLVLSILGVAKVVFAARRHASPTAAA